jgi:hypothetical protein
MIPAIFAILLILLGIGFILFGNYSSTNEKESSRKWKLSRYLIKQLFNPSSKKNSRFQGEIRKRVFNKKYPEKEITPEIESIIKQERELDSQPTATSAPLRTIEPEPDLKDLERRNSPLIQPQVQIESISKSSENESKISTSVIVMGTLYLDYGKEIPMDTKTIQDSDHEESIFQHFRRIGKAELVESEGRILYRNQENLFEFPIQELEKIVFYDNAVTMFPITRDLPNFLFFTKETGIFKEKIREDLREF